MCSFLILRIWSPENYCTGVTCYETSRQVARIVLHNLSVVWSIISQNGTKGKDLFPWINMVIDRQAIKSKSLWKGRHDFE